MEVVPSACPHDCTSTCALEVERLDARTIGRVRGSMRNTHTRGVICEKVARFENSIGISALTSSGPGFPHSGAVSHDAAVWVRKG